MHVRCRALGLTTSRHTPRMRGIQYAAASRFYHRRLGILDRPPSRAMTSGGDLAALAPEVCYQIPALCNQRAQGRPGARCTRGLACKMGNKNAHEHTGSAEAVRPSLRNGFTAYNVLSPVT